MPEPRSPGRGCRARPKTIAAAVSMHDRHRVRRPPPRSGSPPAAPGCPGALTVGRAGHVAGIAARVAGPDAGAAGHVADPGPAARGARDGAVAVPRDGLLVARNDDVGGEFI